MKYFSEIYPAKHLLHVRDIDFNLSWQEVFSTSFQMNVCEYYNTIRLAQKQKQKKNTYGLQSFQNNFMNILETALHGFSAKRYEVYCPQFVLERSVFNLTSMHLSVNIVLRALTYKRLMNGRFFQQISLNISEKSLMEVLLGPSIIGFSN